MNVIELGTLDSILFVLYSCVFVFQERLKALTDIVWPEIALLVKKRIKQAKEQGEAFITFIHALSELFLFQV